VTVSIYISWIPRHQESGPSSNVVPRPGALDKPHTILGLWTPSPSLIGTFALPSGHVYALWFGLRDYQWITPRQMVFNSTSVVPCMSCSPALDTVPQVRVTPLLCTRLISATHPRNIQSHLVRTCLYIDVFCLDTIRRTSAFSRLGYWIIWALLLTPLRPLRLPKLYTGTRSRAHAASNCQVWNYRRKQSRALE
jgi:hypothetical protein